MNFVTLSIQMTCFATILLSYPFFYPKADRYWRPPQAQADPCTSTETLQEAPVLPNAPLTPGYRLAKLIVYLNVAYLGFGATLITMLALFHGQYGLQDPALKSIALVYGIISVTLTCIQYLPQLWKTFRTKVSFLILA